MPYSNSKSKLNKLYQESRWDSLIRRLDEGDIDPSLPVENGYTLAHMAIFRNQDSFIHQLISTKKYQRALMKADHDGNTPVHLAAKLGNLKLFKLMVQKIPQTLNMLNNYHHSPLWYLIHKPRMLWWVVQNFPQTDFSMTDYKGNSFFNKLIKKVSKKNDRYYRILNVMIKKNPETTEPLMIYGTKNGNLPVLNMLKDKGFSINQKNSRLESPLGFALYHNKEKVAKFLIDSGADVNYRGIEGRNNPISYCLIHKNYQMIDYLIDHGYRPDNQSRMLATDLHRVIELNDFPSELLCKFLHQGDLNIQNINGDTPLHFLLKKKNWRNYDQVLIQKPLDIYVKNSEGKTPISYLDQNDLNDFYNLVTNSYLFQLKGLSSKMTKLNTSVDRRCQNEENSCQQLIKKQIKRTKRSIPKDQDNTKTVKELKNLSKTKNFGRFSADYVNGLIYLVTLIKKHKNLGIPFQYYDETIHATDSNNRCFIAYRDQFGDVIADITEIYHNLMFELSPSILIWKNRHLFHLHPRFHLSLKKLLLSPKIRFIFMKLSIVVTQTVVHANAIIYDKKTGILERFEPYGALPIEDAKELNQTILNIFQREVEGQKIEFISPIDYWQEIGFQTVSNDSTQYFRKLGDPNGYCLAWSLWYLEMRITNPDVHPRQLISKIFKKIINQKKHDSDILTFINYIRNYAHRLDAQKNHFLKSLKFKKMEMYNLIYSHKKMMDISKGLVNLFQKSMKPRINYSN